jgi:hypothetical protein
MTIKDVHDRIRLILDKSQVGYVSPVEIDHALDMAQIDLFNELYGNARAYQPGRSVPPLHYGATQKINDALSPFKVKVTLGTADTANGLISLPVTYVHLIGIYKRSYNNALLRNVYKSIKIISEDELANRLDSFIFNPSTSAPVGVLNGKGSIQLFPMNDLDVDVHYLRRPATPVFGYSINSSARTLIYDANSSTQLEWSDIHINNIISKAVSVLGASIKDPQAVQFGELKDNKIL